ncbi:MAG: cell division protein FtsZ [Prevotellaceae bacterium]|jgi:cell division protein FtsZ|nr:cell division protein FtsZ [Prevotellaceae bacterium]
MEHTEELLPLAFTSEKSSIIKVIGVGGGGCNAVNHMYRQGIKDVDFVVCNTDIQALKESPVPNKIQLGVQTTEGLGAGAVPEIARRAAEESSEQIEAILRDNTKMVFITAGMGGGTGTGASPVVARIARELGILTVGIVTIPFAFELEPKIRQALLGVAALNEHVDALLVINNEKLWEIDPNLNIKNAFNKADEVLSNAAKAIAEIVTVHGHINIDFADVYTTMKDGNVAIMNTGEASGENRIKDAIENALSSPLSNTDVKGANKILLNFYCSSADEHLINIKELSVQVREFTEKVGRNVGVIWGVTFDDKLEERVKITLIATGFDNSKIPGMPAKPVKLPENPVENPVEVPSNVKDIETLIKENYGPVPGSKTHQTEEIYINLDDLEDENTLQEYEHTSALQRRKLNLKR